MSLQPCLCGNKDYLAIRTDILKGDKRVVYCDVCGSIASEAIWNRRAIPAGYGLVTTSAINEAEAVLKKLDRTYAKVWERRRAEQPGYVSGNVNVNHVGELMAVVRALLAAKEK